MVGLAVVMTTVGSDEQAGRIAETLVQEGLAACVNIIRRIRSIYRWKGELWDDEEFLLIIKTRAELFDAVRETIRRIHSYELPEVICFPVGQADPRVEEWILAATRPPEGPMEKPAGT
jgi:periplasmic divalent cation tolerance protein